MRVSGHVGSVRGLRRDLQIGVAFVNSDDGDSWLHVDKALECVAGAIAKVTESARPTAAPAWQR